MHEQWQDQIPFYVAGTLSPQEAAVLEQHLNECAACRRVVQEWRIIADAVRAEAEQWSKPLPPLSAAVREHLKAQPVSSTNGFKPHGAPPDPEFKVSYLRPQTGSPRRRGSIPATLAAALILLILFGALVIFVIGPGMSQPQKYLGSGPDDGNTTHQDDESLPTETPFSQTPSRADDLGILPVATAINSTLAPTATLEGNPFQSAQYASPTTTPIPVTGVCSVISSSDSAVRMLAGPGDQYTILNVFSQNEAVPVVAKSDNGWYRVLLLIWTTEWYGWVNPEQVNLVGNCSDLAIIASQGYLPETPPQYSVTPTAQYMEGFGQYYLVVKEAVGPFAAGTRVRLSHAYYNHQEWVYYVVAEDEVTAAEVLERYLEYAPDITPGAPTPTAAFQYAIGMGAYNLLLKEAVGPFPAGTRVRVSHAWFTGTEWRYFVVAQDEVTSAEVSEAVLQYAPEVTPGAPTATRTQDVANPTAIWTSVIYPTATSTPYATPSPLPCTPGFYFTDADKQACSIKAEKVPVQAAYESFEDGYMLWRGDTGEIIVLVNNGLVLRYSETSFSSRPDNPVTDTPPQGKYKPVSGFGRVWGNFPVVREMLGWATALEQGYTMTMQYTPMPVFTNYFYMTLPDGRVVQVHDDNTWNFESP
jgi:hypothetical protein